MPKPVLLSLVLKVLHKKEIPYGTFQSILLQSGLKEGDFFEDDKK